MEPDFRPHRFSTWDGTQDPLGPDSDELFDRLAEDVFHGWDFESALRRMMSQNARDQRGRRLPGLEDLMERLRKRRQRQLERFNLDNIFKDIQEKLDGILRTERQGISERVDRQQDEAAKRLMDRVARQRRRTLDELPPEAGGAIKQLRDYEWMEPRAQQQFQELLEEMQQQITQTYFRDLTQSMQQMSQQDMQQMRQMIHDLNALMRQKLEGVPDAELQGNYDQFRAKHAQFFPNAPESFEAFLEQLRKQMAQMDSLMQSLSPEMRQQMQELAEATFGDEQLQSELAQLMGALELLSPNERLGQRYSFFGGEELPLGEAMRVMDGLQSMENLEQALREVYRGGELDEQTRRALRETLGEEAAQSVDRLQDMTRRLQESGLVRRDEHGLELTSRGMRRIGQKALGDLFDQLKRDRFGNHALHREGHGGERTDDTRPYSFGDPFALDVQKTVMNAVQREAGAARTDADDAAHVQTRDRAQARDRARVPDRDEDRSLAHDHRATDEGTARAARTHGRGPRLHPEDFEVHRSESLTRSSTVLMLDMSRSMPLRGYFYAAKKVALALDSLIRTQYPRDSLYVVGFSDYARQIAPSALSQLSVNEYVYGTNLQHGLMLARQLLARDRGSNKQILIVSDGEPTAHMEGSHAVFFYPPLPETFQKTLVEVRRCTREGIVINTFMLESNHHLVHFVNQMTKLNRGRAFFISPDRLGDYVLVDYVKSRGSAA